MATSYKNKFLVPTGRLDGQPIATGKIGETLTLVSDGSLRTAGNTQNTYLDVPAITWTLQPGVWMILAQGSAQIDVVTGAGASDGLIGSVAIRTSTGVVVAETVVSTANLNLQRGFGGAPVVGFVNISATTSYKMSG